MRFLEDGNVIVSQDGEEKHLYPIDYKLMMYLAINAGEFLSWTHLLDVVWPAKVGKRRWIRDHVAQIRSVLGAGIIETGRARDGVAYRTTEKFERGN
ncbi:hypothetical protein GF373_17750 [bacterium]|nr:hypothetical protein [bacterium]